MFYMSATSMLIMMTVGVVGVNTIVRKGKEVYKNVKEKFNEEREKFKKNCD